MSFYERLAYTGGINSWHKQLASLTLAVCESGNSISSASIYWYVDGCLIWQLNPASKKLLFARDSKKIIGKGPELRPFLPLFWGGGKALSCKSLEFRFRKHDFNSTYLLKLSKLFS